MYDDIIREIGAVVGVQTTRSPSSFLLFNGVESPKKRLILKTGLDSLQLKLFYPNVVFFSETWDGELCAPRTFEEVFVTKALSSVKRVQG